MSLALNDVLLSRHLEIELLFWKKADTKRSTRRPLKKIFKAAKVVGLFTMNWDTVISFLFGENNLIFGHAATACNKIRMIFIHVHNS